MKVLVTAASRHGTTAEIAEAIAGTLREDGLEVDVVEPDEVASVDGYGAVVIGSAVYAGHWMGSAKELIERHRDELRDRVVFLFSSGPLGDPPKPVEEPVDVAAMDAATGAIDHRIFAGRLAPDELSMPERFIVRLVHAPSGDFRPWADITTWAHEIARFVNEGAVRVRAGVD